MFLLDNNNEKKEETWEEGKSVKVTVPVSKTFLEPKFHSTKFSFYVHQVSWNFCIDLFGAINID